MKWFRPFRKEPQTAAAPMPPPRTPDPAPIQIDEVTPHMVQSALDAGEALLFVDVRQRWDYEMQRPARAISLPLNELPERYDELDRSQRIVLTCYHGYTSLQGAAFLMQQGFVNVQSMSGGFAGWAQAGLPIAVSDRARE
ncbi:MAG: rhodanese-like domain-containing protein [Anaerolineales bacterium]|nr:rhodanese-like domain-containing protein [Anaerolineales bacterium]MCB9128351.1 rhodanese-like domain-containing protein [Ardenticatenales bacterium]MCB9172163.1 rhodanese-like domain-containing protein [Ardenticatenales bacterium]